MFKCDYDIKSNNKDQNTEKMTLENYKQKEREKGKHASSTENRRLVWEYVIWPLILEVNRNYFTLQEYQSREIVFVKTKKFCLPRLQEGLCRYWLRAS